MKRQAARAAGGQALCSKEMVLINLDKLNGALRLCLAVALVALVLVVIGILEEPPEENRAAVTAATVAATEEYDRVMEENGCREAAQDASDIVFEEVMERWSE